MNNLPEPVAEEAEEDLQKMTSLSYLIQDCDQFVKILLEDLLTNSKDLPDHIKAKTGGGHILDLKKIAIF